MAKYSEVFVAFDVAKKKRAAAIAEGGGTGEVRFMGDVENNPAPIERTIKGLANRCARLCASKPERRDTVSIAGCRRSGMTAWWLLRR